MGSGFAPTLSSRLEPAKPHPKQQRHPRPAAPKEQYDRLGRCFGISEMLRLGKRPVFDTKRNARACGRPESRDNHPEKRFRNWRSCLFLPSFPACLDASPLCPSSVISFLSSVICHPLRRSSFLQYSRGFGVPGIYVRGSVTSCHLLPEVKRHCGAEGSPCTLACRG